MPSRRTYLATLAAAGLAGCVGETPGTGTDSESPPTTTAPGTAAPSNVIVEAAAVQYAYRHIEQVDWNGIRAADGQFVFVTVDVAEPRSAGNQNATRSGEARPADSAPAKSAFTLVADGESYAPIEPEYGYLVDLAVPGSQYWPENEDAEPRGWLVFGIPAELDSAPTLRLDRDPAPAEWALDVDLATSPPPAWEWSVDTPETVAPDTTFDIAITAENVGDGPGTFRGAVNFSYPLYRPKGFDIALDPGESGTESVEASTEDADPGQEIDYGIRTPAGQGSVSVTIESDSSSGNESA
ncbi:hypothetical protein [Halolamina salifodinae]|uniref:Uncharacterized protein n=1 Tax=Halolamina salifodinae TaxID=1202767 RepID=A0A8T4H074_9EURY|nr:hypothetical protein [Halolamina salifodinae]MBP1987773.1 hypothetical protein [Halolamina salifodinae]